MKGAESLLSYLDAPIVVGDPEGRAVYVNPAFEQRFPRSGKSALGLPLAELFDGGAREAVLRGVVAACEQRETARFRLRAGDVGFSAVASPIETAGEAVGVVILFKEEIGEAERLLQIQRDMQSTLDELGGTLDELLEQTGGRRNPQHRTLVEDGVRAVMRMRKWSEEMQAAIAGQPARQRKERIATADLLKRLAERAARHADSVGTTVTLLAPGTLPELVADEGRLSGVLQRMVAARLDGETAPTILVIGARRSGKANERALIVSLTELRAGGYAAPFADGGVVDEALATLGAKRHALASEKIGRTTVVRIPLDG